MSARLPLGLSGIILQAMTDFCRATEGFGNYCPKAVDSLGDEPSDQQLTSVIGFSGERIKGSCAISCAQSVLGATHPNLAMGMPVGEADAADWLGEIANQLLGRIKNKMSTQGVAFTMATPTTMRGREMRILNSSESGNGWFLVVGEQGNLAVHFKAEIDDGVCFDADDSTSTAAEGSALLF